MFLYVSVTYLFTGEMSAEPQNGMPLRKQKKDNMVKCDGRL
jgi:hypothetical protein